MASRVRNLHTSILSHRHNRRSMPRSSRHICKIRGVDQCHQRFRSRKVHNHNSSRLLHLRHSLKLSNAPKSLNHSSQRPSTRELGVSSHPSMIADQYWLGNGVWGPSTSQEATQSSKRRTIGRSPSMLAPYNDKMRLAQSRRPQDLNEAIIKPSVPEETYSHRRVHPAHDWELRDPD